MKKKPDIFLLLILALGVLLIANSLLLGGVNKDVSESIAKAKEEARPADIELTIISDSECAKCSDVTAVLDSVKSKNNVKEDITIDMRDSKAQELIAEYRIEKIPSIIIKGELDKAKLSGFEKKGDAMVLSDIAAPYTDAASHDIKGLVELTYIKDSDCEKCFDLTNSISQLKQGIVVDKESVVEFDSKEGKIFIEAYGLKKVPTIILSQEFSAYPTSQSWQQVGTVEEDGSYVMRVVSPPFINTTTNRVIGLVELTYLTDDSCKDCYDVNSHNAILLRYGIDPVKEETVDVSSAQGKALVEKYSIKAVPTIILSKEASNYPALNSVWKQVGTVEEDGSYLFVTLNVMGKYRNLTG